MQSDVKKESTIFIEEVENPVVTNTMFRLAKLIMKAEEIESVVVTHRNTSDFSSSRVANDYFPLVRDAQLAEPNLLMKFSSFCIALIHTFFFPIKKIVLGKTYKGLLIGPTVYDAYLAKYKRPTYVNWDIRLMRLYFQVILNIKYFTKVIEEEKVSFVLTSHRVGLRGSSLSLAASHKNIPIFSFGGDQNIALIKSKQAFAYEYRPLRIDLEMLRNLSNEKLEDLFTTTYKEHLNHKIIMDSKYAFSGEIWKERVDFVSRYNSLDLNKPFVFILPHVYTDYPNTLFRNPSYSDYYEWFADTLKLISKVTEVNWIIREHPSSRFYGLRDDEIELLSNTYNESNFLWISADDGFSSESIKFLADAVITYIGSAGYEYPAMYGIPSIYWNHAPYAEMKIGTEIHDKKQYENFLETLHLNIHNLSLDRLEAKRHYIFSNMLCRVPYPIAPQMTQADYIAAGEKPMEYIRHAIRYYNDNYDELALIEDGILKQLERIDFQGIRRELSK